ncbi:DUF1656 domain-containing protein [Undibacterium terreum]|uniref:DUF1656 domain-containing protein n=1 Tax=Undibacterium terreum TaxID=1224302 RepID=A0A916UJ97_9BURK|nr:DUF1656 domain-containing protein [Undibacterium terreum]GGC74361.1 DUF1656 domain-containing protein [Undibacterium terreum]
MPREIALFDALVPTLLLVFVAAMLLQVMLDRLCAYLGVYRFVWHPGLFRVAMFVCVFGGLALFLKVT